METPMQELLLKLEDLLESHKPDKICNDEEYTYLEGYEESIKMAIVLTKSSFEKEKQVIKESYNDGFYNARQCFNDKDHECSYVSGLEYYNEKYGK